MKKEEKVLLAFFAGVLFSVLCQGFSEVWIVKELATMQKQIGDLQEQQIEELS